jgi:ferredoxin
MSGEAMTCAVVVVEHSVSYSNPTEMHDRMLDLAAAADWPSEASE